MTNTITIDPVTRIEGHAKITIHLEDDGSVRDAFFHVTQFRGFEKLCENRPFAEMPSLMARICGICPVSHLIASAKACDGLLAVRIPSTGAKLRQIMNLAQFVQSHALSFFHLSSPDLLLGMDAPPEKRNIFGVVESHPELARDGIRMRQFGQQVIEWLGGKRIHPAWIVPGGVNSPLTEEIRNKIRADIPEVKDIIRRTLRWYKKSYQQFAAEIATFANFPSLFMGLVGDNGDIELYDGALRMMDSAGNIIADRVEPERYSEIIEEAVESYTYLKFPYYKPMGYPMGFYRVGPLARLNVADQCGTPEADEEHEEFKNLQPGAVLSSFHYHYARLIEILHALEKMDDLLKDPDILDSHVRAVAEPNSREGIGVAEAPRGTLIHHYRVDDQGLIQWANMIIATGHNNMAMNRGVTQVAKHFVHDHDMKEGMLNRVEAVIRTYDPCLSCSTHAVGQMPMRVQLVDAQGQVVNEKVRE